MGSIARMILMLLAVLILIYFLFQVFDIGKDVTACEALGGTHVVGECDQSVSRELSFVKVKEGESCCRKKAGISENTYNEWAEIAPKPQSTIQSGSTGSGSYNNPGQITQISRQVQENNNGPGLEANTLVFTFEGKPFTKDTVYEWEVGTSFVATGYHTFKDGKYCKMSVSPAEKSAGVWKAKQENGKKLYVSGTVLTSSNCESKETILTQLQLDTSIDKPGTYIVEYVVKPSATSTETLGPLAFAVFHLQPKSSATPSLYPSIQVLKTSDSRQNKLYCWVDINTQINGTNPLEDNQMIVDYAIVDKDVTARTALCPSSVVYDDGHIPYESFKDSDYEKSFTLNDQHFCLRVTQPYTNKDKSKDIWRIGGYKEYSYKECDEIYFYKPEQIFPDESKGFDVCTVSCDSYEAKNENDLCNNYDKRTSECQFGVDCYAKRTTKNGCRRCDSTINKCSDYKNKYACGENDCLQDTRCSWEPGTFTGTCIEVKEDLNSANS